MSEYNLPEGMTAEWLREHADWLVAFDDQATTRDVADDLRAWADAIDPPKPEPVVTDEMVRAYIAERWPIPRTLTTSLMRDSRYNLEAVERLGWLRDPASDDLAERLEMAAGLLRRVLTNFPESVAWSGRAEAEYLRSLVGEGES